jgi:chemotaxis protein methyltransferase CheR
VEDSEYALVKQRLRALSGIDLDSYKSTQVRRRLDGYLGRTKATTWTELMHDVANNPVALHQLRDYLTINVSSFFRDSNKWNELRDNILPTVVRRGATTQVWSAACSFGAEPYSLAMLLMEDPATRFRILATDIDSAALAQARAGGPYTPDDVRGVDPVLLTRHFRHDAAGHWVQPALRSRVVFGEADLLRTTSRNEFDLVVCRNVLIYFTEAAKVQVITGLVQALRPGGVLFIGATESIPQGRVTGVERAGLCFYRRIS